MEFEDQVGVVGMSIWLIGLGFFLLKEGCTPLIHTKPDEPYKTKWRTCVECRERFPINYKGDYVPSQRICDDCLHEHIAAEKEREEDMMREHYRDMELERRWDW